MARADDMVEFAKGYQEAEPGMSAQKAEAFVSALGQDKQRVPFAIGFCAGQAALGAAEYRSQGGKFDHASGAFFAPAAAAVAELSKAHGMKALSLAVSCCVKAMVFSSYDDGAPAESSGKQVDLMKGFVVALSEVIPLSGAIPEAQAARDAVLNRAQVREYESGPDAADPRNELLGLGWNSFKALRESLQLSGSTPAPRAPGSSGPRV